jgi:hypothetical protein
MIPFEQWQPLTLAQTLELFAGAPFTWALGGGYAIEKFLGKPIRAHEDMDVVIFRDEQLAAQAWMKDWLLFAADPPGTLREWNAGEYLPFGIHDIWGRRPEVDAWQFQFMVAEVEGDEWFSRRDPRIRGKRDDLFAEYNGVRCVRIEVQLLYKSKGRRPKDVLDFHTAVPRMTAEARDWLKNSMMLLYPDGHPWLDVLEFMEGV